MVSSSSCLITKPSVFETNFLQSRSLCKMSSGALSSRISSLWRTARTAICTLIPMFLRRLDSAIALIASLFNDFDSLKKAFCSFGITTSKSSLRLKVLWFLSSPQTDDSASLAEIGEKIDTFACPICTGRSSLNANFTAASEATPGSTINKTAYFTATYTILKGRKPNPPENRRKACRIAWKMFVQSGILRACHRTLSPSHCLPIYDCR